MLARISLYIALTLTLISWLPFSLQKEFKYYAKVYLVMVVISVLYHVFSYIIAITGNSIARKLGKNNYFIIKSYDEITTEENLRGLVIDWFYFFILMVIIGLIMWKIFDPLITISDKIVNIF